MAFTDADKERLIKWCNHPVNVLTERRKLILNCVARLEAAELHRDELLMCLKAKCEPWPCEAAILADEVWRKGAGK